jgi:NAD(P)-dependent dehydrogenase (short-subunit alcohol dehydrogenase family)
MAKSTTTKAGKGSGTRKSSAAAGKAAGKGAPPSGTKDARSPKGARTGKAPQTGARPTAARRSTADAQRARGPRSGRAVERKLARDRKPESPYPPQHQEKPGIEAKLRPRPRYERADYKAAGKLEGKVALVTGGDSGIGRAVAVLFAREGADVAFTHLPVEKRDAAETRRAIERQGRRALPIAGDLTDREFCRRAVADTVESLGKLDVLVNNAAFQNHVDAPEEVSDEQWDRTFKTNIYAYFWLVKEALPHLREGAAIVNCGSITGLEGSSGLLDYSATKGAIHAFTKTLAQMVVDRGIRVNCVAPGPVWTPLNPSDKPADEVAHFGEKQPMGRPAQPEEIAPAFVFFASDGDSSYITGEVLTLLGGETRAG